MVTEIVIAVIQCGRGGVCGGGASSSKRRTQHTNNQHTGDLLCCDACSAAYHISCAGLWQLPEEDTWLCNRCKKGAARSKRDAVQRERATGARA